MAGPNVFVASRAQQYLVERGAAHIVYEQGWRLASGGPAVTPAHKSDECGREVHTFGGESVLVAYWTVLVLNLVKDVVLDEPAQPVGEQIASDAEIVSDLAEAVHTTEDVPQYQECPAVSDQIERRLNRTRIDRCWIRGRRQRGGGVLGSWHCVDTLSRVGLDLQLTQRGAAAAEGLEEGVGAGRRAIGVDRDVSGSE